MQKSTMFNPEKWVDNYGDELYRYALVRVSDKGFAEDIVQDTFLSAWRSKESYNGTASEKNWLYAICKNKIIDHFRKQSSRSSLVMGNEEAFYFDNNEHWKSAETPKDWNVSYDKKVETKEFYSVLESCKKKLKSVQQQVFILKYMNDLETSEICETLNITQTNYWVLIHRCKLHLRACIQKNWLDI